MTKAYVEQLKKVIAEASKQIETVPRSWRNDAVLSEMDRLESSRASLRTTSGRSARSTAGSKKGHR
jgi:hypothetical protein